MEMDVNCVDHMHLTVSHCRLFWMLQGEKRDTNTVYQKRAQTDWQRFSGVPTNTNCSAHSQEIFTHTKYTFDQKHIFFKDLKTSQQEKKKKLPHNSTLCFFSFKSFFLFPFLNLWGMESH